MCSKYNIWPSCALYIIKPSNCLSIVPTMTSLLSTSILIQYLFQVWWILCVLFFDFSTYYIGLWIKWSYFRYIVPSNSFIISTPMNLVRSSSSYNLNLSFKSDFIRSTITEVFFFENNNAIININQKNVIIPQVQTGIYCWWFISVALNFNTFLQHFKKIISFIF